MMTTILVLIGIYVYFVIANLFYNLVQAFTSDCSDRPVALTLFPIYFIYGSIYIICTIASKLELNYSIPLTPRKVAEFISNPKNYRFRIKIEKKES